MPAPLIVPEKATWNCTAMYPPDDKPDTDVSSAFTLYFSGVKIVELPSHMNIHTSTQKQNTGGKLLVSAKETTTGVVAHVTVSPSNMQLAMYHRYRTLQPGVYRGVIQLCLRSLVTTALLLHTNSASASASVAQTSASMALLTGQPAAHAHARPVRHAQSSVSAASYFLAGVQWPLSC